LPLRVSKWDYFQVGHDSSGTSLRSGFHDWSCSRQFNSSGREIDLHAAQGKDIWKWSGVACAIGPVEENEPLLTGIAVELQ
jgi:hypothetical protein